MYLSYSSFSDAIHFKQFIRLSLYYVEGVKPEFSDYELGELWPDSLDESTPQVLFDTNDVGW